MESRRHLYLPSPCVLKTSAEIIREARSEMSARLVDTKRPFTPRVKDRRLFGAGHRGARPPSSFSLRQVEFKEEDASVKLPPIQSPPHTARQPWFHRATSLTNLPEESDSEGAGTLQTIQKINVRETHSSPQERTQDPLEYLPKVKYFDTSNSRHSPYKPLLISKKNIYSSKNTLLQGPSSELISLVKKGSETKGPWKTGFGDEYVKDINILTDHLNRGDAHPNSKKKSSKTDVPLSKIEKNVTTRTVEDKQDVVSQKNKIQMLLSELDNVYQQGMNEDESAALMTSLYSELKNDPINRKNNKLNSQIIKTLYKFVDSSSDTLIFYAARVILALRLTGQNLTAVNKLIFKVSRSDKNDHLFLNGDILELFVETLGCASPLEDAEACIYGYGALKFLTMNNQIILQAIKLGIIELITLHLQIVNNARLELLPIPEQTSHAIYQLTSTVRNIASDETCVKKFIKSGLINQMCLSLELFSADFDLISNIARTLSIVSVSDNCCEAIAQHEKSFQSIIKIFSKYPSRQDIIVRLAYALGNVIAKSEPSRLKLYNEPGALAAIILVLGHYMDKDLEVMRSSMNASTDDGYETSEWGSDGSIEDVIVKLIRIVANMSMHPEVGVNMTCLPADDFEENIFAHDAHNTRDGGKFLDILMLILKRKSILESEELVMSALTTLNNLSFYAEPSISSDGPFAVRQIDITQVLSTFLLTNNEESMVEVTRVLGNLSRSKDVRDYILEIGGISQLVRCLDYSNKELLYTTTGVLVNLMADWDKRLAFKENNGIQKLLTVLVREGHTDWKLAGLICQALWNFCIDSTHLYAALGVQSTNHLLSILVDLLDEESLFGVKEGSVVPDTVSETADYRNWEQFATVATNLLERIEQYLESLQAFQD